jgi:integrase
MWTSKSRRPSTCPRLRTASPRLAPSPRQQSGCYCSPAVGSAKSCTSNGNRWDLERGLLFLADSKTGRKTVILNAPALTVLTGLDRLGSYVVPGDDPEKPRADLKCPWEAVARRAGLNGVRLHDLRHTYASFGAGGGLGLPIIGRLLGHTQASTTQRYAHLDPDPLRRASEAIGTRIAAALDGRRTQPAWSFKRER